MLFTELRETLTFTSYIIKDMIKDTDEQPDEELQRARSRGSQVWEHLYLWSWDAPPSQHMDVFTNPEALQTPNFRDFYGGFTM